MRYKIWDRQWWNEFWDNCPYTQKEIYLALRNTHIAVKNGYYESRFISADPCKFIQGGMINRGLTEFDCYGPDQDPNLNKMRDD